MGRGDAAAVACGAGDFDGAELAAVSLMGTAGVFAEGAGAVEIRADDGAGLSAALLAGSAGALLGLVALAEGDAGAGSAAAGARVTAATACSSCAIAALIAGGAGRGSSGAVAKACAAILGSTVASGMALDCGDGAACWVGHDRTARSSIAMAVLI